MMSLLRNAIESGRRAVISYTGDTVFLGAAVAATAWVTRADGQVDEGEQDAAIAGMTANPILSGSFTGSKIEEAYGAALADAASRAGKIKNRRAIEAIAARPIELRQDVFLIAADVADDGGIGEKEREVLNEIAKILGLDAAKLLAA